MVPKWFILFCLMVGSSIVAWVPLLWGAGMFSFSSVVFSALGGIAGIVVAVKIGNAI
jgi:hypothetical protein